MQTGSDGSCIENCGDGKNYGLHQCDDGNNNNGDGCNSKCLVEPNFYCHGGFPEASDKCLSGKFIPNC
jgi:cysteine-rich repeat protein